MWWFKFILIQLEDYEIEFLHLYYYSKFLSHSEIHEKLYLILRNVIRNKFIEMYPKKNVNPK